MVARLKSISVSGFKSLGNITLPLDGLRVLIGDNGSGKSSVLEVLEILRCTTHENFVTRVASSHGGMHRLREHGAERVTIGAAIDDEEPDPLFYSQEWSEDGALLDERIVRGSHGDAAFTREMLLGGLPGDSALIRKLRARRQRGLLGTESMISAGVAIDPRVEVVAEAFRGIEVHLPFQVTAHWAASADRRGARGITLIEPTTRIDRFGANLVNAYQSLKNDFGIDHWDETLEYIQLGLGSDIRDVRVEAIPGGGHVAMALETRHQGRVPAFALADGMLSYLAFVALFRLDQDRTLLAFDEPELHLHPALLMRVLGMLETMSDRYPVVVSTHSDRLLDGLADPAGSVVVAELDHRARTRLRRLDSAVAQALP